MGASQSTRWAVGHPNLRGHAARPSDAAPHHGANSRSYCAKGPRRPERALLTQQPKLAYRLCSARLPDGRLFPPP